MTTYAECPQCGTAEDLVLIEVHEEIGHTDPARHEVTRRGIVPGSAFTFAYGDPVRVLMECTRCGHEWRTRRLVTG